MVDAIVTYAIDKLDVFLIKEISIRTGVKQAVNRLKYELSSLRVYVRVLEEKHGHVRLWIDSVKDVANDAILIIERFSTHQGEHIIEGFSTHQGEHAGILDHILNCVCMCKKEIDLYDIGKEIESLKETFDDIKKRQEEYRINDIVASLSLNPNKPRRIKGLIPFENEVDVVGFENDAKKLLAELLEEDPLLRVVSIHGMGGLGKTTLARKLYDSNELSHFKNRSFVCVSQEYEIKDVLQRIIKSFKGPYYEVDLLNKDEAHLLALLQDLLQGDRYLVVVDDIWDLDAWKIIKKAFPQNKKGGRVIMTTRKKEVAQGDDGSCFVHALRFLTEEESWDLFFKRAKPTGNLEKLGHEMVKKCGGLPLAIVVLSGLLWHKSNEEWSDVSDHLWKRLKNKTLEIGDILDYSYDDLSPQMKDCFLYLSRFPEDYTFYVEKLKWLWIAEDFISESEEGVMEDVAKDCLNELINRNLIQLATLKMNGEVLECKVHDLVRDLSIQKAKESKLLGTFDSSEQHINSISSLQGQIRHTIYNGPGEYMKFLKPTPFDSKLRTLAVVSTSYIHFGIEEMKLVYTRFIHLKVLDLSWVQSEEIPKEIGYLFLLKFLGLNSKIYETGPNVLVIPATISKLKRLQTLSGAGKYEFPKNMGELIELRHLIFPFTREGVKIGSQQTKLQTVETIQIDEWMQIDYTVNFTNIRKLVVEDGKQIAGCSLDSIANLTSLQTLTLLFHRNDIPTIKPIASCKHLKTVCLVGRIHDISDLSVLPDSVTCLSLVDTGFEQDPMQILGTLSNLTFLQLMNAYNGKRMYCHRDAFPNLEFLRVDAFNNLKEYQAEDGAMPSLKGLDIDHCYSLMIISPKLKLSSAIPSIYRDHLQRELSNIEVTGFCELSENNRYPAYSSY